MRFVHKNLRKKIALRRLRGAIDRRKVDLAIRMPGTYRPAQRIIIGVIIIGVERAEPGGEKRAVDHQESRLNKVDAL
jgi:hypothetical protein